MRNFQLLALTSMLLITMFANATDSVYNRENFLQRLAYASGPSETATLCLDFAMHAGDFDLIRDVQDAWARVDQTGLLEFYRKNSKDHPNDVKAIYLYARINPSRIERVKLGREIVGMDPKWPYGYRLLLYTYCLAYFQHKSDAETFGFLQKEFPADEAFFDKYDKIETDRQFADKVRMMYLTFKGRTEEAEKVMARAREKHWDWATAPVDTGRMPQRFNITPESLRTAERYREKRIKEDLADLPAKIAYYRKREANNQTGEASARLADCYTIKGDLDSVFYYCDRSLSSAEAYLSKIETLPDYAAALPPDPNYHFESWHFDAARSDPRWQKIESRIAAIETRTAKLPKRDYELLLQSAPDMTDLDPGSDYYRQFITLVNQSDSLLAAGKLSVLEQAIDDLPGDDQSLAKSGFRARLYAEAGDLDRAYLHFNKYLDVIGDDAKYDFMFSFGITQFAALSDDPRWNRVERRISLADSRLPVEPYHRSIAESPRTALTDIGVLTNKLKQAERLGKQGKYDEAVEICASIKDYQNNSAAHTMLAFLYSQKGDMDQAFSAMNRAIEIAEKSDHPDETIKYFGSPEYYSKMFSDQRWKPIGERIELAKSRTN